MIVRYRKAIGIIAAVCACTMSAKALSSGKAIIPHITWGYTTNTHRSYSEVNVSNIGETNVTIVVSFYNADGTLLTDGDDSTTSGLFLVKGTVTNYDESPSTGESLEFVLGANMTASIKIEPMSASSYERGYGRIEWYKDGHALRSLIAHGQYVTYYDDRISMQGVVINKGKSF